MDKLFWERVKRLFIEALTVPSEERATFLLSVCGDDQELLKEVQALLVAHETSDGIDSVKEHLAAPERVGPYRILRELGRGGMGVVYLGRRDDGQFEQTVAIKLLKLGMDTEEIVACFLRERRILANLEHPNISRLIDGGVSPDGRPFFAMEYIDGEPFRAYCKQLKLVPLLRLFQKICRTVHFAHTNLIIHRDIKPDNLLITKDGEPKILDFGIAGILNPGNAPAGTLTRKIGRAFTPDYASPEQLRGAPMTTASDIYSLGILLFEMLCGERPYKDDTSAPEELCLNPSKPSDLLEKKLAKSEALEPGYHQEMRKRVKSIRGDLDQVVLKALNQDPNNRYRSALELEEDLTLFLNGFPVKASKPSFLLGMKKFIGRHRKTVAVAGLFSLLLMGFIWLILIEKHKAEQQRYRAEQFTQFMIDFFDTANPYESGESSYLDPVTLLETAEKRLQGDRKLDELTQAEMIFTLGNVHVKLGNYDHGEPLLRQALDIRTRILGGDHLQTALSKATLAECLLFRDSDLETAKILYQEALLVFLGEESDQSVTARTMNMLGSIHIWQGRIDEGIQQHQKVIDLLGDSSHPEHRKELGFGYLRLGVAYKNKQWFDEAEAANRQALSILEKQLDPGHPWLAHCRYTKGLLLIKENHYDAAQNQFNEALKIYEAALGRRHHYCANILDQLGLISRHENRLEEAEAYHLEAREIFTAVLDANHPAPASSLQLLAFVYIEMGDLVRAEEHFLEALKIREKAFGGQHPMVAASFMHIARLFEKMNRLEKAQSFAARALPILEEAYGGDDSRVTEARSLLSKLTP